jgi:hypothetical protein
MALHAAYAIQIRSYNNFHWQALEQHLHVTTETGDFNG